MHNNGVTHMTVPSDVEGVAAIIDWLGYIPKVCPQAMRGRNQYPAPLPPPEERGPSSSDPQFGPHNETSRIYANQGPL